MNAPVHTIPEGYWRDAQGRLIPEDSISDLDKLKDSTVRELVNKVIDLQASIRELKREAFATVASLVQLAADQYDIRIGGDKGNVTLYNFDGQYKIQRSIAENLAFDEKIQAAKALVDDCLSDWTADSNDNLKMIVNEAFNVDQDGNISINRVLALRRLPIQDPNWQQAMNIISDSLSVIDTTAYVRFYQRDDQGKYLPIPLDIAKL